MRENFGDDVVPPGLHRGVNQHLEEQVALRVAAAQQSYLLAPRVSGTGRIVLPAQLMSIAQVTSML